MTGGIDRRAFLGAAAGTAMAIQVGEALGAESAWFGCRQPARCAGAPQAQGEVDEAIEACPVLFQPLGTIEWHGLHSIVGVDALKAHRPLLPRPEQEAAWWLRRFTAALVVWTSPTRSSSNPRTACSQSCSWLERLASEAVRQGFRAVIFLTGHYGAQIVVRETALRMSRTLGVPWVPEYFLALDEGYHGDHAAWGETVLMMYLYPESVDLSRLGEPPHQGVGGRDPREVRRPTASRSRGDHQSAGRPCPADAHLGSRDARAIHCG